MTHEVATTVRVETLPALEEHVALSRFTTLGTGGPARYFARPESRDELRDLLAWADAAGVAVEVVGLGSNILVHDGGVDALVVKLARRACGGAGGRRDPRRPEAAPRTPSAFIAPAPRVSAASSSRPRSRAPPAAASA